jgi:hypothetical protein
VGRIVVEVFCQIKIMEILHNMTLVVSDENEISLLHLRAMESVVYSHWYNII